MAGLHGSFSSGMTGLMMAPTEEFQEEDVWGLMSKGGSSSSFKIRKSRSGPVSTAWGRSAAAPTAIPRSASTVAGVGIGLKELRTARGAASAPVEIPNWSRILKEEPKKTWWDDDDDDMDACNAGDDEDVSGRKSHHHVNNDDDDVEMLPPHEFLARRIRRIQVAYSMCEGIGRTLKGRDLSNLRNAILAKTGFLE